MYKEKIEKHFNMPFNKIISDLHWGKSRSLNSLSKECGVSHTVFVRLAKSKGLILRNKKEASSLNMKIKQPMSCIKTRNKRAKTISKTFIKKLLPQEKYFKAILEKFDIQYSMQEPIGSYNIDFFIPSKKLCIEIDSPYKWGKDRKKSASLKDKYLLSKGFKVIRLNKVWLEDIAKLVEIIFC